MLGYKGLNYYRKLNGLKFPAIKKQQVANTHLYSEQVVIL